MKDLYRILGLKDDASEEEIRARWVELTKQHHPDRLEDASSDQRIREINEAYQVLKHSSTRVEYDLKRTYGKEARKRMAQFKRWGVSAGVLIMLIIVGVIFIMSYQSSPPPASVVSNGSKDASTNSRIDSSHSLNDLITKLPNDARPLGPHDSSTQSASTHPRIDASSQSASTLTTSTHKPISASTLQSAVASAPPKIASTHKRITASHSVNNSITKLPNDSRPLRPHDSSTHPRIDASSQSASTQSASTHPRINSSTPQRSDASAHSRVNSSTQSVELAAEESRRQAELAAAAEKQALADSKTSLSEAAVLNAPSALGTEDEVRKFFNHYVERYNRMDLEGLFSLFSSEAVQNKKDGIQNIRKIYSNFFNQGREVRYRVQDMRIEIYQNAVEVKARYEIDQILRMGERMVWKGNVQWVLGKENGILKIRSLDYQHQQIY